MFTPGSILYFEPFYFKNNATPKTKYFIVLNQTSETTIIASLPTSKDHIPSDIQQNHGCIEDIARQISCYHFSPHCHIAKHPNGEFSFSRDTYIYGAQIDEFNTETFIEQLNANKTTITSKGILYPEEFTALLQCLKNSSTIKRKFKRIL